MLTVLGRATIIFRMLLAGERVSGLRARWSEVKGLHRQVLKDSFGEIARRWTQLRGRTLR